MNQALKKLSATVLAATMLLSFIPTAYADEATNKEMSTFDFGASDYAFNENDGTATIKITREGTGNEPTKVVFKAADLVSEYGVDYEILDEKGKPYKKVEGDKPDPAEFVFKETGEEDDEITATTEESETTLTDEVKDTVEEQIESTEVPDNTKTVTKHDTGSNLLNAQADYLGLPGNTTTEEVKSETKQILDELYAYYDAAQGAECVVEFGLGETEKEITIKINDNDQPNSQKIFSLCLMATNSDYTTIAPNATTYVTIQDDEETQPSDYAIVEDDIRLTQADPTATVTIKRTGGEMYFSTVELSTVTLSAPEGSFEALENKAVAFVPGQTEATVEIKALDFSKGGTFGLRLDLDCDIDTLSDHYADVTIVKDFSMVRERSAEEMKNLEKSGAELETETLAADSGNVLGNRWWYNHDLRSYGGNTFDTHDGAQGSEGYRTFYNTVKRSDQWSTEYWADSVGILRSNRWGTFALTTKNPIDLSGISYIRSKVYTSGRGGVGFQRFVKNKSEAIYTPANSTHYTGTPVSSGSIQDYQLDTNNMFGPYYLALGNQSGGDPSATNQAKYNVYFDAQWTQYTFESQQPAQTFTREIYDFSTGAPEIKSTFFEGTNKKIYNPSKTVVLDNDGNKVSGFYANYGDTVYIHSANSKLESDNGLFLKGVYLVNNSKDAHSMGDGTKYDPKDKYYYLDVDSVSKKSDDPYVSVKLDQAFVKTLADKGVVTGSSTNIKIFPVYERRDVNVYFFNTDNPRIRDGNRYRSYYDENNRYSEITNIIEAYKSQEIPVYKRDWSFDTDEKYQGKDSIWRAVQDRRDTYRITVPTGTVIRMGVSTVQDRIPDGVSVYNMTTKETTHEWYKPGEKICDEVTPNGATIREADYTKADVVVYDQMEITPVTGEQGLTIAYVKNEEIPEIYKGTRQVEKKDENGKVIGTTTYEGLEMSVVTTESLNSNTPEGVDKDGKYKVPDVYTGMEYSFTAVAPEGYVTEWKDLTGDTNGDGYVDENELAERRRYTDTPAQVYGNVFAGKVNSDQIHLAYHFVKKTSLVDTRERTGEVSRSNANFLQLMNNVSWSASEPVSGAMVNLGGDAAMTDANGKFKIASKLPVFGTANLIVTDSEGTNSYSNVDLSVHSKLTLPALEEFNAVDMRASTTYRGDTNEIQTSKSEGVISVYDGSCSVWITVNSKSTITPAKAHFFITDEKGNVIVDCDEKKDVYSVVNKTTGTKLESKLTFNPKKDCYANYQLWVQFEDAGGKRYNKIATGYVFSKPLDLGQFVFPLIGSSSLENFYRSDFVSDLIGDPLGDIGIESIPLERSDERYSPSSLSSEAAQQMSWTRYSYSYAWGKDFKLVDKKWGDKKKDSDKDKKSSDSDKKSSDSDDWVVVDKSELDEIANEKVGETAEKLLDSDDSKYSEVSKENKDGTQKKEAKSKFKTQGSFNFSISPSVGFRLTLSQRSDKSKYYFEDLLFYVQLKADMSVSEKIVTPIGVSVIIDFGFSGKITGIYYMYNNYNGDPLEGGYGETENDYLCEFSAEDFGLFKKFDEGSSVRRDFYLFIDPTLSVSLGVDVGIASVTISAKFVFDFDFRFTEWKNYAYGDLKIFMSYKIEVLGIKVWEDSIGSEDGLVTVKIFNTDNQNGHISFDPTKAFSKPSGAYTAEEQKEKFATDDIASRAYLDNRTAWNGTPDTPMNAEGTTEITLEQGAAPDARVQLQKLNDNGDMLMVWVDDDAERTDINRRAIYYSISSGDNWSTPKQIDNDGTLDDYPNICDIGNGKLLVTWSSADRVLKDNEGVEEALKALDIKAAFFDKETREFGKVEKLTKTTREERMENGKLKIYGDYTADLNPHAAYDAKTDRIILYYTKTEYEDIDEIADIGSAASVTAYLFYEDGKWSNDGSFYTDEELSNMDENYREFYKKQWYGQRFLDLRTKSNSELFLAVDSTAIGYNGLGLFAWTIDWDKNLSTNDDRDVFMQIYDFNKNTFTHVIKLTNETGVYTQPKFARSGDSTYLFFGTTKSVDGDPENIQSEIDYLNISDAIKNEYYTLVKAGEREYYELSYEAQDAEGNDTTINIEPQTAMPTENIEDYEVTVAEDGRMYIFWSEKDKDTGTSAQINAAYFLGDNNEGAAWSNGLKITEAAEGEYYTGIGATVIGDSIKLGAVKSSFADEADNSLVFINHVPYSKVSVSNLDSSSVYPMPGDVITLSANVNNEGLKAYDGDVNVKFTIGNDEVATATVSNIAGAQSQTITATADCPDFNDYVIVQAETTVDGFNTSSSIQLTREAQLDIANEEINLYTSNEEDDYYAYTADVTNIGNLDSTEVTFTVYKSNGDVLYKQSVGKIAAKASQEVKIRFDVENEMFNVDENGLGSLDVYVTASYGEMESEETNFTINKQFDKETMELLDKVTNITFENGGKFTMKSYEEKSIMPNFEGVEDGQLRVIWTDSSDPEVVGVFADDSVTAYKSGKATLTGYIVPNKQNFIIDGSGRATRQMILDNLPTDYLKEVTVEVSVENEAVYGDLDADGIVNSSDALMALRISVGLEKMGDNTLTIGDIDGDGEITSADALQILRYSVQLSANDKIGKAIV